MTPVLRSCGESESPKTLAAVQITRKRQAESDLQIKEATSGELTTKTVKTVTQVRDEKYTRDKLRASSSRGYQQNEARLGNQRD